MESNDEEGKETLPANFSELLSDKDTDKEIESFLEQELIREKNLSQDDVLQIQPVNEQMCNIADANHANITKEEVCCLPAIENSMQTETKRCEKSPGKHMHNNNANDKAEYDVGITVEKVGESSSECMELPDDLSGSNAGERDNPSVVHTKVKELVAEKNCMQIQTKMCEKRNEVSEESPRKHVHNSANEKIEYDVGINVENVGESSLEGVEHPDDLSESKTEERDNSSVVHTKVKELVAEGKSVKMPSPKTTSLSPLWGNYILSVRGVPPRDAGHLKRLLNGVLGDNCYRIRPSQKGATDVYLHFLCLQDMQVARQCLHNQSVANYKLTVTMDRTSGLKQKSVGNHGGPAVKRMKKQKMLLQFYEKSYEEQIELKMTDIRTKLQDLSKYIAKKSPKLSEFIHQRQLEHGGAICALDKFKDCSPSERIASAFFFSVGSDEETGQLIVGIYEGDGQVRKLSSVNQNYPDHVLKITKVFEEFVHTQGNQRIWHKLLIYTNSVQDLMLLVFLDCTNDKLKQVCEEMKTFFTSGEAMKCRVTSVYIRDMNKRDTTETVLDLVIGAACLEDTIAGLRLQLPPIKQLWNSAHGAETMCRVMEKLLAPSKKMTVLEICCGSGLVGLYLSKAAGEVLSVGTKSTAEVTEKNAALNEITNCRYFGGKGEDMIPKVVKERKHDEICAVVMCCKNRSCKVVTALEQLRKVQQLNRLVLVEDKAFTFNTIQALSTPSSEKEMGNPFFPVKAVPVDCPNSKGYLLLILLERIIHDDMERFGINGKLVPPKSDLKTKASASRKLYVRGNQGNMHSLPISVWERTVFSQQGRDMGPESTARAVHNSLLPNTAPSIQLQAAEKMKRAYFGAASNLENVTDRYCLREMLIEKQRRQTEEMERRRQMLEVQARQIQEEEWNRRMLEEKRRQKQVEEEWIRHVQEEEQRRRIQEEEERQIQEEQRRQIQEEEWNRQIQEEQRIREAEWMRHVQEGEQRRRIQEEEERQIQEEEWKRRIQEEQRLREADWMRCIQEDERRRQIQEEEERQIQEEQRRQIQEEEHRRRTQEEEWRKRILEEEQRRRMLDELQKREMLTEERKRQMQEEWMRQMHGENYRRPATEETYRRRMEEWESVSLNFRSRNVMVGSLMADSRSRAAIPQFSADMAQRTKHLVQEASMANQVERHDVSTRRGVHGIHPEEIAVSRFVRHDFEERYSRQNREADNLREHSHDMYGGGLKRQDDLKSQQYSLSRNQETSSEMSLNPPSLLELKLKPPELSGAISHDVQHPLDRRSFLDVGTNQRSGWLMTAHKELDMHAKLGRQADRFTSHAAQYVDSARGDIKPAFSLPDEQNADIFRRRSDLD